jgi:Ni/Co efflux regulator RcnB
VIRPVSGLLAKEASMIRLAASTLILALAASAVAQADPPHHGGSTARQQVERGWQGRGGDRHVDRRTGGETRERYAWRDRQGGYGGNYAYGTPRGYYYPPARYRYSAVPRGYAGHRWARGEWLPPAYRTRYYYVPDYWHYGYRVYAPPVGCRWVRHDDDLILTALATGLVLDVVYDAYR